MARSGRRRSALLAVGLGLAIGAALITASLLSSGSGATLEQPPVATQALSGVAEVSEMLDGVPQDGTALGSAGAPVTLVEYADLQCPYCAQWAIGALPRLIEDFVRAGKLRIEFRGLAFIGPDSETALRTVLAAGRQDRLWHAVELLYANQGAENSGWVSQDVLREIGDAVPGLDVERALRETQSQEVESQLAAAKDLQARLGVRSTPAFAASRAGGQLAPVQVTSLDAGGIALSLDRLLAR